MDETAEKTANTAKHGISFSLSIFTTNIKSQFITNSYMTFINRRSSNRRLMQTFSYRFVTAVNNNAAMEHKSHKSQALFSSSTPSRSGDRLRPALYRVLLQDESIHPSAIYAIRAISI